MKMYWLWGTFVVSLCLLILTGCGQPASPVMILTSETPTQTETPTKIPTETQIPIQSYVATPVITETPVPYDYHLEPALTAEDCITADLPEEACTGVKTNQMWTPVIREFSGVEMVLVPAGCFMMGYEYSFDEEKPAHEVCIDRPYWIDRTEVTVQQYAEFLNGISASEEDYYSRIDILYVSVYSDRKPHVQLELVEGFWVPRWKEEAHPQEYVTWEGAYDLCTWRGANLPTEVEWEYAARGPDNLIYPWGNTFSEYYVVRGRQYPHVGSKPQGVSWVGALDMAGSEFEWTRSLYWPYPYDPDDGRENGFGVGYDSEMVFRGSALYHDIGIDNVASTARYEASVDVGFWYHGARCARPVE